MDLVDRKKLIILVDIFLAAGLLLFILIKGSYSLILVNTFFVNSLVQFFMPSESSSIPILVPKKLLFFANSLFALTLYGTFMVGFTPVIARPSRLAPPYSVPPYTPLPCVGEGIKG